MKRTICFVCLLAILTSLLSLICGCSPAIRTDLSAVELMASIEELSKNRNLLEESSLRYISGTLGVGDGEYDEFSGKRALSEVCDEFGVFKCHTEDEAVVLCERVNQALELAKSNWDGRYYSTDADKVANASAIRFGQYVLYTVVGSDERRNMENKFKELLKG